MSCRTKGSLCEVFTFRECLFSNATSRLAMLRRWGYITMSLSGWKKEAFIVWSVQEILVTCLCFYSADFLLSGPVLNPDISDKNSRIMCGTDKSALSICHHLDVKDVICCKPANLSGGRTNRKSALRRLEGQTCTWTQSALIGERQHARMHTAQLMGLCSAPEKLMIKLILSLYSFVFNFQVPGSLISQISLMRAGSSYGIETFKWV